MEENLEDRPALGFEEPPSSRGEYKGVPCRDSEGADEEILVRAEMGREIQRVGKLKGVGRVSRHGDGQRVRESCNEIVLLQM